MRKEHNIRVGISIGDLNGIGGEIVIKTLEDERILDFLTPVIFASVKTFSFLKKHFNSQIKFNGTNAPSKIIQGKVNVVNTWKDTSNISFGTEDKSIGKYALKSLEAATQALKQNDIDVLVTAPINKHNIQSDDFKFPGHTDYLASKFQGESLMLMISGPLRVGLLTDHVPVKDVVPNLTEELITTKINNIIQTLKQDFTISKPKIAVLGINPHSGDQGVIGSEDDTLLKPTLQKLRDENKLVFGPYSADSFFASDNYKNFDAIIASYHDQGLIPFKTLSFGLGVNFTAGLSKIRTSPDHGTAYEIAGQGKADNNSFKEAVFAAIEIFKNRQSYKRLSANPLEKQERPNTQKKAVQTQ